MAAVHFSLLRMSEMASPAGARGLGAGAEPGRPSNHIGPAAANPPPQAPRIRANDRSGSPPVIFWRRLRIRGGSDGLSPLVGSFFKGTVAAGRIRVGRSLATRLGRIKGSVLLDWGARRSGRRGCESLRRGP